MTFEITLSEIAVLVGGNVIGNGEYRVSDIVRAQDFRDGTIVPLWEKKFASKIKEASVLLTKKGWIPVGCSGVEVEDPRRALTMLLIYIENMSKKAKQPGIHPTAFVDSNARLGKNVYIGPNCVVSSGAMIGDNCVLEGSDWIGENVTVGDNCLLEPGVIFYEGITVGNRCIFHANAIIGCDGFGFMPDSKGGIMRIPQCGTVVINDDVEIGCETCIDKATFGETIIGCGTKIDALVKVGHNAVIGDFTIVVAQSGIAGSSTIGSGVTMAAQSGIANHATIGDGCTVAGRAGVASDIPAGSVVSGFPARDHKLDMRIQATVARLPEFAKEVRSLSKAVKKLEEKILWEEQLQKN